MEINLGLFKFVSRFLVFTYKYPFDVYVLILYYCFLNLNNGSLITILKINWVLWNKKILKFDWFFYDLVSRISITEI